MVKIHARRKKDGKAISLECTCETLIDDLRKRISTCFARMDACIMLCEKLLSLDEAKSKINVAIFKSAVEIANATRTLIERGQVFLSEEELSDRITTLGSSLRLLDGSNEFACDDYSHSSTIEESILLWAGKAFRETNIQLAIRDLIGTNEKTTMVVSISHSEDSNSSGKVRDHTAIYENMVSYLVKRNSEIGYLESDDGDDFLSSEWANPGALKNNLIGNQGRIVWKF
jgi:hypothetical protein